MICATAGSSKTAKPRPKPMPSRAVSPADLATVAQSAGETAREGIGFGLGFAVLLDPAVAQIIGTPGEFYWGGAASTAFFVNPAEEMIMIFLTQLRPSSTYPIRRELRSTIYSAITE